MATWKKLALFGFLLSTLVLLAPTASHAQCTGSGTITCTVTQSVSIPGGQAANGTVNNYGDIQTGSPYPSTLTISGLSGTIATISVQLHGLTSDAVDGCGTQDLQVLLQAPNNGPYLELMGSAGNCGTASPEDWTGSGVLLNIQDGPATTHMPYSGGTSGTCADPNNLGWPIPDVSNGSSEGTFAPTSCPDGSTPETYPPPGPGTVPTANLASQVGTATLNGTFDTLNPNGTWNLYFLDNYDPPGIAYYDDLTISGWSLVLTLNVSETSTNTSLSSSVNPSFTSGTNSSTTLTATVTGTPSPSGGTVTFKNAGTDIACSGGNQTLSGGQATCVTTFTTQGDQALNAVYSGSGSFSGSTSSTLNQFVETPTTGAYCNAGGITLPGSDNTTPYPSVVNVTGISNAVSTVSVTLNGFSWLQVANAVHLLLVAPSNQALEFFAAGDGSASSGTYTFIDTGNQITEADEESTSGIGPGTYQPAVYTETPDSFTPQPPLPAPQVPGTFSVAAPAGSPSAGTFENTFNGATANGAWSLFAYNDDGTSAAGSITGGWCIDISQASGAATTTAVASATNPALTGVGVTVTATVTSGGNPVTAGTVSFTENGANVAGGPIGPVSVSGAGQASFTTTTLPEGDHNILATYNGSSGVYALSFASVIQRVDNISVPSQNGNVYTYCNPGTITIPNPNNSIDDGPSSPYPSNIFVTSAPGTIQSVTVSLNGVELATPYYLTSLLVGPLDTTANSLDLFSYVGGSTPMTSRVNLTLDDSATSTLFTGSNASEDPSTGSYKPTSGKGSDTYGVTLDGFYNPPAGPYAYAAPIGSSTLTSQFAAANALPNGTWSLYLSEWSQSTGSSMSSWCVNLTENPPVLTIGKSHEGNFSIGQTNAEYTIIVGSNGPGSTGGLVTVTDTLPTGLTATAASGTGWTCPSPGTSVTCTRSDALTANNSYPAITVTVTVGNNTTTGTNAVTNSATVSGGGAASSATANDPTTIIAPPVLSVTKAHTGSFTQGQTGVWTITVGNTTTGSTTSGTVTVSDALPSGYTVSSAGGTNWSCAGTTTLTCTDTTDAIAGGLSYPAITLTANVPAASPTSVQNTASAAGGGAVATANSVADTVTVVQVPASVTANSGTTPQGATVSTAFTTDLLATVKDAAGVVIPNYSSVTFTAASVSGASGTFSNSTNTTIVNANPSGVVDPGVFTANGTAGGPYTVTASAGAATPAVFYLTNNPLVAVTIQTVPTGLLVSVDGNTATAAPVNVSWQSGTQHSIATTSPQTPATGTQDTFVSWSDAGALSHSVTASTSTPSYTATFSTSYLLTTAASPVADGTVSPTSGTYYAATTVVPVTATANSGYNFSSWTGPVASSTSASTTVTMSAPESVTASFAANNASIIINTSPTGLLVSVDGGTASAAPVSVSWQVGSQHTIATTSPQTPTTGTQYTFVSWSDSGTLSHSVTVSSSMPSYTATFSTSYLLTTAANPPADGVVSPTSGTYYAATTVVPLTATANSGYNFSSWAGPVANASSASTTVTMSAPESVTANFATNNASITINTSPTGLLVSVDGGTASAAPVHVTWQVSSQHTIATTSPQIPTAGTKYTWASWSDGGALSHSVTASSSTLSYTATFSTSYLLTTAASPSGGGTVTPVSGNYYAASTVVHLVATPSSGYVFSSWTGSPVAVATTSSSSTVTMSAAPETVTANFGAALVVNPSSVNFGTLYLGQVAAKSVTLTNSGSVSMTISSIKASGGTAPGDYGEITGCTPYISSMPGTLGAGKSCTIVVGVDPSAKIFSPNPSTSDLIITDSGPGSPQTVPLTVLVINPLASLSPTSLSFSTQKVGTTSTAKTVKLTNTGNTVLDLGTLSTTGNFAILASGTTCENGGTVAAGGYCEISVEFTPTAKGLRAGTLKITDNALSSPQAIILSGTGD
jgi:hypothetical protein